MQDLDAEASDGDPSTSDGNIRFHFGRTTSGGRRRGDSDRNSD